MKKCNTVQSSDIHPSNTVSNAKSILSGLIGKNPTKSLTDAAIVVSQNKGLLRRAIRKGYSLDQLSAQLNLPKRSLQRHLSLEGLFFRQPRVKKGKAIKPYKPRGKPSEKAPKQD
jgi:hypothetical protein